MDLIPRNSWGVCMSALTWKMEGWKKDEKDGGCSSLGSWQIGTKFELTFSRRWGRESGHGANDSHGFPWEFYYKKVYHEPSCLDQEKGVRTHEKFSTEAQTKSSRAWWYTSVIPALGR
jgi:hypothetical protein